MIELGDFPKFSAPAACAEADPELWFAATGQNQWTREAKRICATCPVISECLEYALPLQFLFGVWGGLTADERARLRRKRGIVNQTPISDDPKWDDKKYGHGSRAGYKRHYREGTNPCKACRDAEMKLRPPRSRRVAV